MSKLNQQYLTYCALSFSLFVCVSCQTKSEIRREQEVQRLKAEVKEVRGDRADLEVLSQEMKVEMARLNNTVENHAQSHAQQMEDLKKDLAQLQTKVLSIESKTSVLEQRAVAEETTAKQKAEERSRATYENAKRLYEDGHYIEASEMLKEIVKARPNTDEAKKSQYLLAETYFANKEYASAAIEYSEYQKKYAQDILVPNAIFRQAQAFKLLGKKREARLFYQEVIERFPKSIFAQKAKYELKKIK